MSLLRNLHRNQGVLLALEIAVPLGLLAGYAFWARGAESFYFPPLTQIAERFVELWFSERFAADVLPSMRRLGAGYALSVVIGVTVGLLLGLSKIIRQGTQPFIEFLRAVPSVALIPFGLLVFGVGDTSKVFIIVIGTVWPILLNTIDGVKSVEPGIIETSRAYNIGKRATIVEVILPFASPRIVAGMRTSMAIAIILMVVSEMVASSNGIGFFLIEAQRRFAIADMWAGIVLLGLIGYGANFVFVRIEQRVLYWHLASKGFAK